MHVCLQPCKHFVLVCAVRMYASIKLLACRVVEGCAAWIYECVSDEERSSSRQSLRSLFVPVLITIIGATLGGNGSWNPDVWFYRRSPDKRQSEQDILLLASTYGFSRNALAHQKHSKTHLACLLVDFAACAKCRTCHGEEYAACSLGLILFGFSVGGHLLLLSTPEGHLE